MNVKFACSIHDRLRGLLGCNESDAVLVLAPCNDVHTFGMKRALDIAFVSPAGVVLESRRAVGPRRRIRCRQAALTLERFADNTPWYKPGDHVQLEDPRRNP